VRVRVRIRVRVMVRVRVRVRGEGHLEAATRQVPQRGTELCADRARARRAPRPVAG